MLRPTKWPKTRSLLASRALRRAGLLGAALGAALALFGYDASAAARQPDAESLTIDERIEAVRQGARLLDKTSSKISKTRTEVVQWYNWNNWRNHWPNHWQNWRNF